MIKKLPSADDAQTDVVKLALGAAEAAEALSVSERHLTALVAADAIPHVRLGNRILFSPDVLRAWFREQNQRFFAIREGSRAESTETR